MCFKSDNHNQRSHTSHNAPLLIILAGELQDNLHGLYVLCFEHIFILVIIHTLPEQQTHIFNALNECFVINKAGALAL